MVTAIIEKKRGRKKPRYVEWHASQCNVCLHEKKGDIEVDYLHCIPMKVLVERYGVSDRSIVQHAFTFGLDKKRDRKNFYWRIIENVDLKDLSVENAIEAAKQLDRIEHKVDQVPMVSNIQVIYKFAKDEKLKAGGTDADDGRKAVEAGNRLRAVTDAEEVSSE